MLGPGTDRRPGEIERGEGGSIGRWVQADGPAGDPAVQCSAVFLFFCVRLPSRERQGPQSHSHNSSKYSLYSTAPPTVVVTQEHQRNSVGRIVPLARTEAA